MIFRRTLLRECANLAVAVFLTLFLVSYGRGWLVRAPAWRSTYPFPAFKTSTLLGLGWMFLILGFVFRIVIGRNVPITSVLRRSLGSLSRAIPVKRRRAG